MSACRTTSSTYSKRLKHTKSTGSTGYNSMTMLRELGASSNRLLMKTKRSQNCRELERWLKHEAEDRHVAGINKRSCLEKTGRCSARNALPSFTPRMNIITTLSPRASRPLLLHYASAALIQYPSPRALCKNKEPQNKHPTIYHPRTRQ